MTDLVDKFVYPGDVVENLKSISGVTVIGPGLRRNDLKPNSLIATKAGTLKFKKPNTYWIDNKQKRYVPKKEDLVVGIIIKKTGDTLKIDLGSSETASLSMFAFEGATKKQKPDVQVGDVVYAKMLNAHREMEPELVCIDSHYKAGNLGVLPNDGFLFNISPSLANRLLSIENPLLTTLGKRYVFEIALGMNGKVWLHAKKPKDVLTIMGAFRAVEKQDDKSIVNLCRQYR